MSKLKQRLEATKRGRHYCETKFILEVTDALADCLEDSGVKKKDLASKLGLTRGRISQLFSGEKNLTLRTLAGILWASGKRGRLVIEDMDQDSDEFHPLNQCIYNASSCTRYTFKTDASYCESNIST
ncbi:putative XRE-type DNA-binding protein [Rhodopirellula rubra]|uniref:Putative XRE-type DNA-binding protein n=1 Tax=Aporhodopirellula rubra TaxID=980271 RepID=A0A7W5H6I0_9BACT|nr:helix-turn-helix transcriptional regulator [Aporhodopirellula rubra]MBB3207489.1 putative XRE-type DNA-binding protein [Aporhodopirellula rubra]